MKEKYALLKNIFLSNFNRLSSPYRLTYALTYRCNLTCKICLIWKKRNSHELSIYEIKRFFKRLNNLCWLDLTGGEITLRGDVEDVIDIIIENSPYLSILHLSTNGQIPEKILSIAERILKHK
ncbi:MAG TPA: 4Fe-4S cluster-binding domain-containing protein, partial [Candidatus Omnitrophica bacterium]|nr:4Fe-4S cluster-binding domain-containing protein [Candidatus Omnitrophota bacterium]